MTRLEFLTYVKDSGFKRTDKDDEVYTALDEVLDELSTLFTFEVQRERWYVALANGQYDYPLPSTLTLWLGDVRYIDDAGASYPLNKLSPTRFFDKYSYLDDSNITYADPVDYCILGNQIYIAPYWDTWGNSQQIEITGGEIQTRLTADGDSPDFAQRWDEVIKHGVLYRLDQDLGLYEDADRYLLFYQNGKERMIAADVTKQHTIGHTQYEDY